MKNHRPTNPNRSDEPLKPINFNIGIDWENNQFVPGNARRIERLKNGSIVRRIVRSVDPNLKWCYRSTFFDSPTDSKDFNRLKRGESVVRIRETSEVRTFL